MCLVINNMNAGTSPNELDHSKIIAGEIFASQQVIGDPIFQFAIRRVPLHKTGAALATGEKTQGASTPLPKIAKQKHRQSQRQSECKHRAGAQGSQRASSNVFNAKTVLKRKCGRVCGSVETNVSVGCTEKGVRGISEALRKTIRDECDREEAKRYDNVLKKLYSITKENQTLKIENFRLKHISCFHSSIPNE